MSAFYNDAASRFMPNDDPVPATSFDASSPSESQLPAMRGAVTAMADALSSVGVHEHRQHSEVTP